MTLMSSFFCWSVTILLTVVPLEENSGKLHSQIHSLAISTSCSQKMYPKANYFKHLHCLYLFSPSLSLSLSLSLCVWMRACVCVCARARMAAHVRESACRTRSALGSLTQLLDAESAHRKQTREITTYMALLFNSWQIDYELLAPTHL